MSQARILVVGSMNRDYVCRVPSLPRPGETLLGGELQLGAGGKGGNQAVAVARMGGRCSMVGCVGDDADGQALLAALVDEGIDVEHVSIDKERATGAAFVFVDPAGENSIVVAPGANAAVTATAVDLSVRKALSAADVLVAQAEISVEALVAAVRTAGEIGARVVLNLAPFRSIPDDVLQLADPLIVNESEAKALLGRRHEDVISGTDLASALGAQTRSAVVTLGGAGAVVCSPGWVEHVPTDAVEVIDSTGAGDAFTGVLAACLADSTDLLAAVRYGVAAGTYAVQRPGAQSSYPTARDLFG